MDIKLVRKIFTDQSTIGELSINGKFECFTLEDIVRAMGSAKVHGKTAIPEGIYEVTITFSNKFQKQLPLLNNVPNFDGIRIHSGNKPADTEGCILVGQSKSKDFVGGSRAAFNVLFPKLQAATKKEKIFMQVVGGSHEDVAVANMPDGQPASGGA